MKSSTGLTEQQLPFEEKRGFRPDRRIRDERRAGRDPKYMGEVRRYIIDRRMGTEDRRKPEK